MTVPTPRSPIGFGLLAVLIFALILHFIGRKLALPIYGLMTGALCGGNGLRGLLNWRVWLWLPSMFSVRLTDWIIRGFEK